MKTSVLWLLWLILPVFVLAYHYGPGQMRLARDQAASLVQKAQSQSALATQAQEAAYQSQLKVLTARRAAFVAGVDWQAQPKHPLSQAVLEATAQQDSAYEHAAEVWNVTAELYGEATDKLLKAMRTDKAADSGMSPADQDLLESLRWAEARAMVRSGEVFHGVEQLQALLDLRVAEANQAASSMVRIPDQAKSLPTDAIREELAAAQYIGARLLREEGRPPEVWRPVANEARQHYRFLSAPDIESSAGVTSAVATADDAADATNASLATNGETTRQENANARPSNARPSNSPPSNAGDSAASAELDRDQRLQRNLEQVLNLEQSTSDQLEGLPLPRRAPLARRPGDGEPGKKPGKGPGRGPLQDGPPGDGAGIPGPFGVGW